MWRALIVDEWSALIGSEDCANSCNHQIFFILCNGKKCIPSLSINGYSPQNFQTYSMFPEKIRLLTANFKLVGVHTMLTIFHL